MCSGLDEGTKSLYNQAVNLENCVFLSTLKKGVSEMNNKHYTLHEYINFWLDVYKKTDIKPATRERLIGSLNMLSGYPISRTEIADLDPITVQMYINTLTEDGYSYSTIKKQLELIKASLRIAVKLKMITENPADDISLPNKESIKKKKRDVKAYDTEEQARIQEVIKGATNDNAYLCVAFMIETGLRSGEALALKWKDVSIERVRCNVHATVFHPHEPRKARVQDSPKSEASVRTIPLTPKAVTILKILKLRATCEFVFERDNRRLEYPELVWATKRLCKKANVPYKGEHVFRHTFATNCYYKGIDIKILSRLLGHSDIKVTLNTYVDLYGDGFDTLYTALCL